MDTFFFYLCVILKILIIGLPVGEFIILTLYFRNQQHQQQHQETRENAWNVPLVGNKKIVGTVIIAKYVQ